MKKLYLLLLLILPALMPTNAQPTITGPDFNPFIGLSIKYYTFTPFPFDPGPAGANVTWDFSGVAANDSMNSTYVDPATTTHASIFPNATIANQTIGTGFEYLIADNNYIARAGIDASGLIMPYSDEETILTYPCTYNTTFTDSYAATFTAGGFMFYRTGSVTGDADAYGTLLLPWGSVTNVLRVHLTETYQDSSSFSLNSYTNNSYIWVTAGTHYYLCSIANTNTSYAGSYIDASTVGINKLNDSNVLQIFPNPASKFLDINLKTDVKVTRTTITDIAGKVLYSDNNSSIIRNRQINVEFLSPGHYFLNIESDGGTFTSKFTKQ